MAQSKRIGDLLERPLDRPIEEIIKVSQADERVVQSEIDEYVVTNRISEQYSALLQAIADGPGDPDEAVGIWVSGFFGSGKSSFTKNLGYAMANRSILGTPAAELFKTRFTDQKVRDLVDFITARIPTEVIMFDIAVDDVTNNPNEPISQVVYRVLLRALDYAEDFDLAELEIHLEKEGRLEQFQAKCEELYGQPWERVRIGAEKISRASAILQALDPRTYPDPESWARSVRSPDLTVGMVVDRIFELSARRRPGRALAFVIDEVGQYVAQSSGKIENLRALVEQLGQQSRNRVLHKEAIAPIWLVITSQEKLDEVVDAMGLRRTQLARLQDRFRYRIDLAPADIREVAAKRVLKKRPDVELLLRDLFRSHQGELNFAAKLESTSRRTDVSEDDFVLFYPYLPHFIELSIDIMAGVRLLPGAPRHLGGSNRTIIKQAYEMLVSPRTRMAQQPVGELVTLDRIYELVEGNLSSEKQRDVTDIIARFKGDPADGAWAGRTAKALALLEHVRDLPRTPMNVAALLIDRVGAPAPRTEIEAALERLRMAQFVRETEEGFKLQTAEEKTWDTEKRALGPKLKDRAAIRREMIETMIDEGRLKTFAYQLPGSYQTSRTFPVGFSVEGTAIGDLDSLAITVVTAEDADRLQTIMDDARDQSRQPAHADDVYWVFASTPEIDDLTAQLYASREMIRRYEQEKAQNRISPMQGECLGSEKVEESRLARRLTERMAEAFHAGTALFRGIARDGSDLGKSAPEAVRALLNAVVPELYPKLGIGARALKASDPEDVLKAANLNALSPVFYGPPQGLDLVTKEGDRLVPNTAAPIAAEVLNFLRDQHEYGTKVTGKALAEHFGAMPYGWERDVLRLVLAVLLRAGAIEMTHQGMRFRGHQEPQARLPFASNPAFNAASFAPREAVDLKVLTTAVRRYEELTGREADVDEGDLAAKFKAYADAELGDLMPLEATARAHQLPVVGRLAEYRQHLETIRNADSQDCVRILAGEGQSLREERDTVAAIRRALDEGGLSTIASARRALDQTWPALGRLQAQAELLETYEELGGLVHSEDLYAHLSRLGELAQAIQAAFEGGYRERHEARNRAFSGAIEEVRGSPDWPAVSEDLRGSVLSPLASRACDDLSLDGAVACRTCGASVGQMESDLAALSGLKAQVLARVQELANPEAPLARVRLADYFPTALDSPEAVDAAVERLRMELHKLLAEGRRVVLE